MTTKKRPRPKKWASSIKHNGKTKKLPKIKPVKKVLSIEHTIQVDDKTAKRIWEETKHTKRPRKYEIIPAPREIRVLDFDPEEEVWPTPHQSSAFDIAMIIEEISSTWGEEYIDDGILLMPPIELLNKWDVAGDDDITVESQNYLLLFWDDKVAADPKIESLRFGNMITSEDLYYVVNFILNEHQIIPEE